MIFTDGPIDPKQLTNPYNPKKTTARVAALLTKGPLNDHDSGSGEPEPGPSKGPDPLKILAESVSNIFIILGDPVAAGRNNAIFSNEQ